MKIFWVPGKVAERQDCLWFKGSRAARQELYLEIFPLSTKNHYTRDPRALKVMSSYQLLWLLKLVLRYMPGPYRNKIRAAWTNQSRPWRDIKRPTSSLS